jgi:hypothetical protein
MRAITAAEQVAYESEGARWAFRLSVKDASSTWRNLADLLGNGDFDFLASGTIREDIDANGMTGEFKLKRAIDGGVSLSPLVSASPVNRAVPFVVGSVSSLLTPGREVKLDRALVLDSSAALTWVMAFHGYLDSVEFGDEEIQIECRDLSALLLDTQIEVERSYCFASGAAATNGTRTWAPSTPLVLNELVVPTSAALNGHFYRVTTVGTTGTAEPSWPTGTGSTVSNGGVVLTEVGTTSTSTGTAVETIMQQLLNDNLASAPTLTTPVSPGWMIRVYQQKRVSLWQALRDLATQIGWDLRYRYNTGLGDFRLEFTGPARSKVTPDYATALRPKSYGTTKIDRADIRNAVRVIFSSSQVLDAAGTPTRQIVEVTDSASISAFGRRFMEIQESSASNIDTSTEATAMATAIVSDLSTPVVDASPTLLFSPWVELGDLYTLAADGIHWDAAQNLAVVSYEHSFDKDKHTTTMQVRGKPSGGTDRWLRLDVRVNFADMHSLVPFPSIDFSAILSQIVGGAQLQLKSSKSKALKGMISHEVHVSKSAGFTPSSSTLAAQGAGELFTLGNLDPGEAYFARVVPVHYNADKIVRGQPGPQIAFTAGQAKALHYNTLVMPNLLPLNGSFEHMTRDPNTYPPDQWSVDSGSSWGSAGSVWWGNDATYGNFISLRPHATERGSLTSRPFPIRRGLAGFNLYLDVRQVTGAAAGYDLIVDIKTYKDAALSVIADNMSIYVSSGTFALNTWGTYKGGFAGSTSSGANFAVVTVRRATAGSTAFGWDVGSVYWYEADQAWQNITTLEVAAINQTGWTAVSTFNSTWTNVGLSYFPVGYYKDRQGRVFMRGLAKFVGASLVGLMLTLPPGFRPTASAQYPIRGGAGGLGYLSIDSTGAINFGGTLADANGSVPLDGISFDTR